VFQVDIQTGKGREIAQNSLFVGLMGAGGTKLYSLNQGFAPSGSDFYRALIEKDLASGKEHELIRGRDLNNIRMSPDGKWITVGIVPEKDPERRIREIVAFPTSGGEPHTLLKADNAISIAVITWMPDGRSLQMARALSQQKAERWMVPIDGGTPSLLGTFELGGLFRRPFRLHPDGKTIAFETQAPRKPSEVWALENFLPRGGK
jgi:hypothetical protein